LAKLKGLFDLRKSLKKITKNFLAEVSQKQNLPFGDSITINHGPIGKLSFFLKNIEKKHLEDLFGFLSLEILDFAVDLSCFCMASNSEDCEVET